MSFKRRKSRPIQSSSIKIHVICEGASELSHLQDTLKGYRHITLKSINGGGYGKFSDYIDRNKDLYPIIFVVADLDKAQKSNNDKRLLNKLISKLEKLSKYNNIFLTAPNIEYWVACCLGQPHMSNEHLAAMGYEKGSKVQSFIKDRGGSFKMACHSIEENKLYCKKDSPKCNFAFEVENLQRKQSNLVYLLTYIDEIQKERLQ